MAGNEQLFSESFPEAFSGFQDDALSAGFTLTHYVYRADDDESCTGVAGPLDAKIATARSIDPVCSAAFRGCGDASRVLIVVSGTHGAEGFMGSAAQRALLRSGQITALEQNTAVLLIHAINPWGFANLSRTTESNVDLNRNFIDWRQSPPVNQRYAELHQLLCALPRDRPEHVWDKEVVHQWIEANGQATFFDILSRGQYEFDDGLFFGGHQRVWSSFVLEAILRNHCMQSRQVLLIDWHTGLGSHGEPYFLCFNEPETRLRALCERWWGAESVRRGDGSESAPRPSYRGLLFDGVRAFLPAAEVAGCVVEIGTYEADQVLASLCAENFSKFAGSGHESCGLNHTRQRVKEMFFPSDPGWRQSALAHAMNIQLQAVTGLLEWRV